MFPTRLPHTWCTRSKNEFEIKKKKEKLASHFFSVSLIELCVSAMSSVDEVEKKNCDVTNCAQHSISKSKCPNGGEPMLYIRRTMPTTRWWWLLLQGRCRRKHVNIRDVARVESCPSVAQITKYNTARTCCWFIANASCADIYIGIMMRVAASGQSVPRRKGKARARPPELFAKAINKFYTLLSNRGNLNKSVVNILKVKSCCSDEFYFI